MFSFRKALTMCPAWCQRFVNVVTFGPWGPSLGEAAHATPRMGKPGMARAGYWLRVRVELAWEPLLPRPWDAGQKQIGTQRPQCLAPRIGSRSRSALSVGGQGGPLGEGGFSAEVVKGGRGGVWKVAGGRLSHEGTGGSWSRARSPCRPTGVAPDLRSGDTSCLWPYLPYWTMPDFLMGYSASCPLQSPSLVTPHYDPITLTLQLYQPRPGFSLSPGSPH